MPEFMDRLRRSVNKALLDRRVKKEEGFPPSRPLVVTGSPRSGTTWLAEVIMERTDSILVWEPLNIGKNPLVKRLGFGWRQHIPKGFEWPEAEDYFQGLLSGKNVLPAQLEKNRTARVWKARQVLFKFCRANMLLPWLMERFGPFPAVHIVRHPCGVVASQLKHGSWDHIPSTFRVPDIPFRSVYEEHTSLIDSIRTPEERLAFVWALENKIPLSIPEDQRSWETIFYEDLVENFQTVMSDLSGRWQVPFEDRKGGDEAKPSMTTTVQSPVRKGGGQDLMGWRNTLSTDQVDRIMRVVEQVGMTLYQKDAPFPQKSKLKD